MGQPVEAFASAPHPVKEGSADKTRAAELFKKSSDAYLRGEFAHSIALLDEAYALDPQPVLLYNLARAHEGLGHVDEAISLYERYLTQDPTSADRGAIEQRLIMLRRQKDERAAVEKDRAALERDRATIERERAEKAPVEEPPRPRSIYPYVVAGVGGVGLLTGTIFGVMALSKKSAATDEHVQTTSIDLRDKGKTFATVSNVSFVVGAVLVAAGVVWWVLETPRSRRTGASPLRLGVGPAFVSVGGTL